MDIQSSTNRRIMDLKKYSIQLKQTTQDPHNNTKDLLFNIFKLGRQIIPIQKPPPLQSYNKNKQDYNTYQQQPIKSNSQPQIISKLFNFVSNKKQSNNYQINQPPPQLSSSIATGKTMQQSLTPVQQINYLRDQNNDIQEQIKILKDKLKKLEQLEKQQRQEQWRDGLPYFVINIPKLRIFYTKLTINEKDYDKIDYSLYSVDLNLQKIVLNQLPQSGISSRPPKSICLMLTQLKQVSYPTKKANPTTTIASFQLTRQKQIEQDNNSNNIIVYHFKHQKNNQNTKSKNKNKKSVFSKFKIQDKIKQEQQMQQVIQTLFIKFDNEQQYKQWDLGVFINYKIMEDLNKGQIKMDNNYNNSSINSSILNQDISKNKQNSENKRKASDNINVPFNDLIQKINLSNKKIQNIDDQQSDDQNQQNKQKYEIKIKTPSLKKLNSNFEDLQNNRKINKQNINNNNNIKINDQVQSPVQQSKTQIMQQQLTKKQRSQTSHFGNQSPILSIQQKIKQAQLEKEQTAAQQVKKQKFIQVQQQKKKERMEAMKKTQLELSIKRARDSLRKGYVMTKYAKSALNPYDKKIYLSEDGKKLCWEDIKSPGDPKSIAVSDITGINQGVIGKGVEAHLNPKKISKKGCFVVIYLDSKDRKTLDLSTKDQLTMQEFCKQLQLYRRSLKQRI